MSRKRRDKPHASHERWLVSYADFITLLFAFFVVMYAASSLDKAKMTQLSTSIEDAFQDMGVGQKSGAPRHAVNPAPPELRALVEAAVEKQARQHGLARHDLDPLKKEIEKALQEEIQKGAIILRDGPEGLIISLSELGFFDSGSAIMRKAAEPSFHRIAQLLADRHCGVRVEGHTDNVPIRTSAFRSNWDLSTARATEIVKTLVDRYQLEPALLSAAGYGEYHPVATNTTIAGRQQNRRVDLVILSHEEVEHMTAPFREDSSVAQRTAPEGTRANAAGERNQ
jgi:chemotaxis protein MotB